jgi:putative BNR repeat neuraminidase
MTLARLLIGGLGSYLPPAPPSVSPYQLNSITQGGGMDPFQGPTAISFGGKTFFTYVDNSGIFRIGVFDETTKLVTGRYDPNWVHQKDVHNSISILSRASDSKIVGVQGTHNGSAIYSKLLDPADPAGWNTGSPTNLDGQLHGSAYTYPHLSEYAGNLWVTYRDEPSAGTDSRWCISHTASSTPTAGWATQTIVYHLSGTRSYLVSALDPASGKLHFIASNGGATVGGITGFSKIGHFYYDIGANTWHKTDGTAITLPITDFNTITPVYSGDTRVFGYSLMVDPTGHPVCAFSENVSGTTPSNGYARFNGTSWVATRITSVGTGYEYNGAGNGFQPWGACLDGYDMNTIYIIKDSGGYPEVWAYVTADGGATFDGGTQKTTGATSGQFTPMPVWGASSALRAMWQVGTHVNYTNFTFGMNGLGL